ncbi:MAG: gfo/Idh/MocA family oxidoreductase [Anaerolineaceae bacterium]|nr:gfo/Idh/MocA family oxidoreductase [Anaerolineaceae bacterium]
MKTYRVAIIGTGAIVTSHIEALRHAGDRVEIVAAVDTDEAKLKAFCEQQQISQGFTNTTDMLSAVQPDLVHVLTPPFTHFDLCVQCLEAGAWVYCEKPLCASLDQFDRLSEAEVRTGRYINTVFQWRFGSAVKHLKRLLAANELGDPLVGVCNILWYRPLAYHQVAWRAKWATETGGATVGHGIHLTDLFLYLFGDWRDIRTIAKSLDRPIEVDTVAMSTLRFENGAMGTVNTSTVSPRQETYLRLDFQRATVECTALYRYTNENWRFSTVDGSPDEANLSRWQTIEQNTKGSHAEQLTEMLHSMDVNERPSVSGAESRRILEFNASLYKSAFTGEVVERGSINEDDPFYYSMNGAMESLPK